MEAPVRFRTKLVNVSAVKYTGDTNVIREAFPELEFTYEIGGAITLHVKNSSRKHYANIGEWIVDVEGLHIVMTQRVVDALLIRVI